MTQCTRTRSVRCSVNPISDLLWQQAQDRETRFIAAQEAARTPEVPVGNWLTISEILRTFAFAPYEFGTLYQGGKCIQAGLTVTNPQDPTDRYLVLCNIETGKEEWQCYCPPFHKSAQQGQLMIQAVKQRIAANREARSAKIETSKIETSAKAVN